MVLLINGSPREKGCTYRALTEVADAIRSEGVEAEIVHASMETGEIERIAAEVIAAEAVIVGSPVYYASASGLCTVFLDELFNRVSGKVRLKPAAAVVSCRRGGSSSTFDQINKYFTISEMVVVSSNYWNQVHGNTPEEVERDEEGMQTMRILGRNIAYTVKAFAKAALPLPDSEKKIRTNYIR